MTSHRHSIWGNIQRRFLSGLQAPHAIAFVPAITLAAFWFGGESALIGAAVALPALVLLAGGQMVRSVRVPGVGPGDLLPARRFQTHATNLRDIAIDKGRGSAIFILQIDEFDLLVSRQGPAAADQVLRQAGDRLIASTRDTDTVSQLDEGRFAICLAPVRHIDLESCIQFCGRLQTAMEEPMSIDGSTVYVSVCVGFCMLSRAPGTDGADWIEAAECALAEAERRGPSAIRAFSAEMAQARSAHTATQEEVTAALESGHIQPWFQPQISTDTGKVTGFESLARWSHPDRGTLTPAEFLPALEGAGKTERLAEVMLYHTLTALKAWDAAGVHVPQVGVNFSGPELANPRLVEKIRWELDRFDLTPDRLAIEILETVVTSATDDTLTRNLKGLADLGCRIDLDDFGTGNASIVSIRRFNVGRIKIDRSFVMKADRDPDQQRVIAAILTMAERLGVETLAEGVETVGEHALLAQLGCGHVQGFGIARPMPFERTLDWIRKHEAKLQATPEIPKRRAH